MPRRIREDYEEIWSWTAMGISLALRAADRVPDAIDKKSFNRAVLDEMKLIADSLIPDARSDGSLEGDDYFNAVLIHLRKIVDGTREELVVHG